MTDPKKPNAPGGDLPSVVAGLELAEDAKRYLVSRWLDQLVWMEGRAGSEQRRYYALRMTAILGGVAIPAMVGWQLDGTPATLVRTAASALGVAVAGATAIDGFLRPGERWRHYRSVAEGLKSEFWSFTQRCGPYRQADDLAAAFPSFVERIEGVLRGDVDQFFAVVQPHVDPSPSGDGKTSPQALSSR